MCSVNASVYLSSCVYYAQKGEKKKLFRMQTSKTKDGL